MRWSGIFEYCSVGGTEVWIGRSSTEGTGLVKRTRWTLLLGKWSLIYSEKSEGALFAFQGA